MSSPSSPRIVSCIVSCIVSPVTLIISCIVSWPHFPQVVTFVSLISSPHFPQVTSPHLRLPHLTAPSFVGLTVLALSSNGVASTNPCGIDGMKKLLDSSDCFWVSSFELVLVAIKTNGTHHQQYDKRADAQHTYLLYSAAMMLRCMRFVANRTL
jgi:hypothetical protein